MPPIPHMLTVRWDSHGLAPSAAMKTGGRDITTGPPDPTHCSRGGARPATLPNPKESPCHPPPLTDLSFSSRILITSLLAPRRVGGDVRLRGARRRGHEGGRAAGPPACEARDLEELAADIAQYRQQITRCRTRTLKACPGTTATSGADYMVQSEGAGLARRPHRDQGRGRQGDRHAGRPLPAGITGPSRPAAIRSTCQQEAGTASTARRSRSSRNGLQRAGYSGAAR